MDQDRKPSMALVRRYGPKALEMAKINKKEIPSELLMLTGMDAVMGEFGGKPAHAPSEYVKKLQNTPFFDPKLSEYEILKKHLERASKFRESQHKLDMETKYGRDVE